MRVFYGHPELAGPQGHAEGGLVKSQALLPSWPASPAAYDVLYVVSSRLPARMCDLYKEARADRARVLLSQAAPACPATHDERWQELNRPLEFLVQRADFVFYQSAFGRRMCDAILGPRTGPAAILPNAVDTDRFVPAAADPAPGELRILLGGTQYREYRLRRALETFALVLRERPDARLLVTGRLKWLPDLGAARRLAEAWCAELGIAGRVEFLGPYSQERAPEIFQQAHVLLHTMALDCCPTVVIEAMACGLPVVAAPAGDCSELLRHCFPSAVAERTEEAFTAATGRVLAAESRSNGRTLIVAAGLTVEATAQRIIAVYERALRRQNAGVLNRNASATR